MVLFLCILTAGMGRMFLADRHYEQQSSWAAGSEGRWTGIVKEAPSVNRDGDAYARYYTELESITYSDGVENHFPVRPLFMIPIRKSFMAREIPFPSPER